MANKNTASIFGLPTAKPTLMTILAPLMIIAFLLFSLLRPDYARDLFNSMRDFISASIAAINKYSAANSNLIAFISVIYSIYCFVMWLTFTFKISIF